MSKFIWVIGSPRSGTTWLTHYLSQMTNNMFDEPFHTHPEADPSQWIFPDQPLTVFKYCHSGDYVKYIMDKWPDSYFVHIYRDPDNVINSSIYPKPDSWPTRDLFGHVEEEEDKFAAAMGMWYKATMNSCLVYYKYPANYTDLSYESLDSPKTLTDLCKFLHLDYMPPESPFICKNVPINFNEHWTGEQGKLKDLINTKKPDTMLASLIYGKFKLF